MIQACGSNCYFQLGTKSNNKDEQGEPIVSPPVQVPISSNQLSSYTVYSGFSIIITQKQELKAVGDNKDGRIGGSLPRDIIPEYTTYELEDSKGRLYTPISAVCGENYALYLVKNPDDPDKNLILYPRRNSESSIPEVLNIGDSNPVSLYGGHVNAAAIDSEGRIIFISGKSLKSSNFSFVPQQLSNGEKADSIACGNAFIISLSTAGHVYKSSAEETLHFEEVSELRGFQICDISGTLSHFFALSKDGKVFGFGDNDCGMLALGRMKKEAKKFTEITALKKEKIKLAVAGTNHSIFVTVDCKLLCCGCNDCGQLPLNEKPGKKKNVYSPVESDLKSKPVFCIAGGFLSVVFNFDVPRNSPNMAISNAYI